MSDREPPRDGGGGGGPTEKIDQKERKCHSCGKKGKKVSIFGFGKGKKLLQQRRKHKGSSVNSGCWAKSGGGGVLCFKQPRAMDSSVIRYLVQRLIDHLLLTWSKRRFWVPNFSIYSSNITK
ncbi:uncharacterized protein LOC111384544 isoform X2 [Olea europaea var. sylvestris]|uniref:uncharacterized protein LOC111384544 isoform X2 n=1 Tax=Olea europaea var. sylvestris TaxID=158386 RepID=UPI000C1D05E6|nr:uncharacterized protein LOC111384544 isoform X2 [Olea europaea var. sylvestris]